MRVGRISEIFTHVILNCIEAPTRATLLNTGKALAKLRGEVVEEQHRTRESDVSSTCKQDEDCTNSCYGGAGLMPNHRPEAIANAFLVKANGSTNITQMKLQKLVYIAHGWMLGLSGQPLVDREPEAWDRGPVFPDLRSHVKMSGSKPIVDLIRENDDSPFAFLSEVGRGNAILAHLSDYEQQVIDHVWSKYGQMGAFKLSDLTHLPNTPWSKTYENGSGRNSVIDNEMIREHYSKLAQTTSANT
jgi:uncharacterized phage-associated protein